MTYLLNAIKRRTIEVTHSSVPALICAVRATDDTVLPSDFHVSSVYGTFPSDYHNDIGEGYLRNIRRVTGALFHQKTIVYRLHEPLEKLYQRQGKRRKTYKTSISSENRKEVTDSYNIVKNAMNSFAHLAHSEEGVAWSYFIESIANEDDFGKKVLRLYTSILQGPLTHLIRRNEISSAAVLASACIQYSSNEFMKAMVHKKFGSNLSTTSEIPCGPNILQNIRILAAGLFCASVADKKLSELGENKSILPSFGHLLLEAVKLVKRFYYYYDSHALTRKTNAVEYAMDWNSGDFNTLRGKSKKLSSSKPFQPAWGNDYDDPFVTGAYFPSLPQVGPLSFNDQKGTVTDTHSLGFCSKHYLQKNSSFTPGALTFSCSCSHPTVLGFKVLERDEGPRAVFDVLVSRFASFPPYIIYDSACGVYKSAVNSLWWVVQSTTLVSDPFHANNHTCSPAFVPSAHVNLNMLNTVSHEQRNRPIANIKGSLQQTGQEVYISLLAYQIIINNIEAKGRRAEEEQVPIPNRSAKDIEWSFFHRLGMNCYCCTKPREPS